MKTKELIRRLQEADPEGEFECCVDNEDIHFLEVIPGYYDGRLQTFVRDPAHAGSFDIVGAKVTGRGTKIKIRHLGIGDLLCDMPEMPVDTSEAGEEWAQKVEKYRERGRRFKAGIFDHPDDQDD